MQLSTPRLILRNFQLTDIDDYWEYTQMPNVGPQAGWPPYTEKKKAYERLKVEVATPLQFAIVLKAENKVIGSIELMKPTASRFPDHKIEPDAKEFGFILSNKYWKQGIMTESGHEMMRYAFKKLKVPAIYGSCATANIGSNRVFEKLGFKVIGRRPKPEPWIDGSKTDFVLYRFDKSDFLV